MSAYLNIHKLVTARAPYGVRSVIKEIESIGADVYIVGGAVRDILMNRVPKDWDIATNASMEHLQGLFPDHKLVGKSFGVLLVKVHGMEIEIAKFRKDSEYTDSRRPDAVEYVSKIETDLIRRDFTINAIAVNYHHEVHVPYALEDVQHNLLRAVGKPLDRFTEDPLRILRAFRFMSEKFSTLHPLTAWACFEARELLNNIATERIRDEFFRILDGDNSVVALRKMAELRVLEVIIPEVLPVLHLGQDPRWHDLTVFEHMIRTLPNLPEGKLRIAGFFHDIGKYDALFFEEEGTPHYYGQGNQPRHEVASARIVETVLTRWNSPDALIKDVSILVENHMLNFLSHPTAKKARRLASKIGFDLAHDLVSLREADRLSRGHMDDFAENGEDMSIEATRILLEESASCNAVRVKDLAINGVDIMEMLDIPPGKLIGEALQDCLQLVLEHPKLNTIEYLTNFVREAYRVHNHTL